MSKNGNNFLLTVVDCKTCLTSFVPCKSDPDNGAPINAEATARLYFQHIFRFHGLPALCRTDRRSQFTADFFREVFKLCVTRQACGAAYHQQSQGLTEHSNKNSIEDLHHHLHGLFEDWEDHLPAAEFTLNHAVSPSLCISLFEALVSFNPSTPLTVTLAAQSSIPAVSEFMQRFCSHLQAATDALY